jgi:hypothetical protein
MRTEVWKRALPDGSEARVDKAYPQGGDRKEREYLVVVVKPDGHKVGACLVGEDGVPKRWYDMQYDRAAIESALKDLPEALLAEQIHGT